MNRRKIALDSRSLSYSWMFRERKGKGGENLSACDDHLTAIVISGTLLNSRLHSSTVQKIKELFYKCVGYLNFVNENNSI